MASADGSGERAALVAEELGLEQFGGDGATVERDEGTLRATAQRVDLPGRQFLAGAALAADQHRRFGGGDLANEGLDTLDQRVLPDERSVAKSVVQVSKK